MSNDENKSEVNPAFVYEGIVSMANAEKERMRKHFKNIIMLICTAFITIIIAIFGSFIHIINSYERSNSQSNNVNGDAYEQTDYNKRPSEISSI